MMATLQAPGVKGDLRLDHSHGERGKQKQNLPIVTPYVRRTDAKKDERFVGGYECEFVNPPPDYLQTECSVCLLVLRSPHITSCCGHNFCKECIERLKTGGKACPLCNGVRFTLTFNRAHDVSLKQIEVYCTLRRIGCGWQGKLELLEEHLNADGSSVVQPATEGCAFVEIPCSHNGCGKFFQRRLIAKHQSKECPKRLLICSYCHKYTSTYHEVATGHWPVCKFYPVQCPNKCTQNPIQRQNLERHLSTRCPLEKVECEFKFAGCKTKVRLSNMAKHMKDCVTDHLFLVARQNQQLMAKLEEKERNQKKLEEKMQQALEEKDEQIKKLAYDHEVAMHQMERKMEVRLLKSVAEFDDHLSQSSVKNKASAASVKKLRDRVEKLEGKASMKFDHESLVTKEQLEACIDALQEKLAVTSETITRLTDHLQIAPIRIDMPEFQEHKRENCSWTSEGFYTHPRGYKVCLRVYANGVQEAKGTYVSISLYVMRGEYDHLLQWPFQANVNIKLLNQRGSEHHRTIYICYLAERVVSGERSAKGLGRLEFIRHSNLGYNPVTNCQYLVNNSLQFHVSTKVVVP